LLFETVSELKGRISGPGKLETAELAQVDTLAALQRPVLDRADAQLASSGNWA
jgi:hypothetical protein